MTSATRERLISAGLQLFSRHGIGQVGLDRVLRQAELTKTTFYNHFSSKEELIREVIRRQEEELPDRLDSGIRRIAGDCVRGQLLAVFDVLAELHSHGAPVVSLLVNAIVEFPSESDPTRLAAVRCKESLNGVLLARAERLGVAEPERLTEQLVMVLDGALINYQVTGSPETLRAGRSLAEAVIAAMMAPADR